MSALDGIKVLDLSRLLPGPYCSMILADHGAEVLAIEDKRFQSDDLFFSDVYRNKRHMTLNLKDDEGKEIFCRLAENADVIIEGFRPGVVERLGVGYHDLKRINPAIIYCSITGYGQVGPEVETVGHDVNYIGRAGVLDQIGAENQPPVIPAVQMADIAGGGMNGVIGILLALHERERSGEGQWIDISMTDGVLGMLTLSSVLERQLGLKQGRSNSMLSHRYGCYNTYETRDNRYLAIGAVEHRFWTNLCQILGVMEYASLQYNEERREDIVTRMRSIFKTEPLSHWITVLGKADVCFSQVQSLHEVYEDPLFLERDMIVEQVTDQGVVKSFGVPVRLSRTPGTVRTAAKGFGADTVEVLTELGFNQKTIEEFKERGVV